MGLSLSRLSTYFSLSPQPHNVPTSTLSSSITNSLIISPPSSHPSLIPILSAEAILLSRFDVHQIETFNVHLPSGIAIHTLCIGDVKSPVLLLLHGWGGGSAFYAQNLTHLSRYYRVYAIDWPGFGASTRAPFSKSWDPQTAENFFIDALYQWAQIMPSYHSNFPNSFHIVAHSLGAYLATVYSIRYPYYVRTLTLASPAGILNIPSSSSLSSSLSKKPLLYYYLNSLFTLFRHPKRLLIRLIFLAWDAGLTPQSFIRLLPIQFGKRLASVMITSRLFVNCSSKRDAISNYFYHISNAPQSAELSLCTILKSGACAHIPLQQRLPNIQCPVTFVYGDKDWMPVDHAYQVVKQMSVNTNIIIVPNAGHHLYFDNPDKFNEIVIKVCTSNNHDSSSTASSSLSTRHNPSSSNVSDVTVVNST